MLAHLPLDPPPATRHLLWRVIIVFTLLAGALPSLRASYLDDIGYTALVQQLADSGNTLPDGSGVTVTQVEATVTSGIYAYMPTTSLFSDVTITNASSASYTPSTSWHANMVGNLIYGNSSMGSGISDVTIYYVSDWYLNSLNYGYNTAPDTETSDVQNHSWVGSTGNTSADRNILNRLDYSIQADDYVAVVGINNNEDGTASAANLLASAYNVISVGVTDGTHSAGTGSAVSSTVQFPHLVVPTTTTSEATAVVSSAASLLIQTGRGMSSANAVKSETIKALLLAGATKSEFTSWTRSDTSPLDSTYGAGELDIQNSYNLLTSGEQTPNTSTSTSLSSSGWDFNTITSRGTVSYYFDITSPGDISIALTWNALYSGNFTNLSLTLANLNLYLYEVSASGSLSLVQQSTSSENVEYIWATGLSSGSYVIQVKSSTNGSYDYAVAWQSTLDATAVPEPASLLLLALGGLILLVRLRRHTSLS